MKEEYEYIRPLIDTQSCDFRLCVWYLSEPRCFRLRVSHESGIVASASIGAIHEPKFGIDAEDYDAITQEADRIVSDIKAGLASA